MRLSLTILPGHYAVCKLAEEGQPDPPQPKLGLFAAITDREGTTIVCTENLVPAGAAAETGWRAIRLEGPFAFTETGILVAVASPLADAGIGIFALSTFETDYVLVKDEQLDAACAALTQAGHTINRGG